MQMSATARPMMVSAAIQPFLELTGLAVSITSSRLNIQLVSLKIRSGSKADGESVNKTLGAMTGLEFDSIDVLGPVKGRLGMGYFDCFCVPSVNSVPPTPENPNPASSRHCAHSRVLDCGAS